MNVYKKGPVCTGVLAVGMLCVASVAQAQSGKVALDGDIEATGGGYITTSDGLAIRSGIGNCVVSSAYDAELNGVDACRGIVPKVAEPEPEPEPEPPAPTKSKVVSTHDISGAALFALNSDQLSEEGIAAIQEVIREVTKYQGVTEIEIIGHTDSTGSAEYNQGLSERRAETVKNALGASYPDVNIIELAESAPDIVLISRGMGENQPIADNATREGRARNRRVEILIKAKEVTFK